MAAGAADLPAASPSGETSVEATLCHNCGAVAPGNYCSQCGQTTHVHMPTLFEFLHEFVSHHIAFEGTLVASLKRLLFSPGRLTLDYFEGKRARYVAPLRLYLTFNVIFFLAVGLYQAVGLGSLSQDSDAKKAITQAKLSDASAAIAEASKEIMADPELTPEQRQAAAQKLAMLEQFAARSALPDAVQKGQPVPALEQGTSASSGTPVKAAKPPKPEKTFTFNFGPSPAATSSAATSASGSVAGGAQTGSQTGAATQATSSAAGPATSSGLPTTSMTLGHAPGKDGDDEDSDDNDNENDAAAIRREVRQEVLASARDAADGALTADKSQAAKPTGPKPDAVTIKRVENSTIPSWVDRYAPIVRRRIEEVGNRTSEENMQHLKDNSLHYAPYTLLALLPVCAFLLQMSFIGRHRGYVENLVAALHGHTFLFIVLLVFVPLNFVSGWLGTLWMLFALVHMIWALSRIYGSRGIGLFMRLGVLAVTYGIAMVFATTFAVFISVLT